MSHNFSKKIKKNSKCRHYCLTFFKQPNIELPEKVRYAIYGEEICPITNNKHWQSYIELKIPMRFAAIKKLYSDNTIHIESRIGTRDQAREYCKKDNKFTEFGKWIKGQGHRTDLDLIVEKLKNGTKLSEIMITHPKTYCQYRNGLKDIESAITGKQIPKFRKVEVVLITGPTGCGKTKYAMEKSTYKIQGSHLKWWQDYDGDKVICIDEYNNNIPIDEMLALLDGYKLRLNIKGTHTYANWDKVFITTNLTLSELHGNAKNAHKKALMRRITKVINFWDEEV